MVRTLTVKPPLGTDTNAATTIRILQQFGTDMLLRSCALAIGSSSKAKVKNTVAAYYTINGVTYTTAIAETAFTATTHDVTNAYFRIFLLSVAAAGTITITAGAEAATLAAAGIPAVPTGHIALGYVLINPTGTGIFDASTTELDDATVAPNAVYINTPFPHNPALVTAL